MALISATLNPSLSSLLAHIATPKGGVQSEIEKQNFSSLSTLKQMPYPSRAVGTCAQVGGMVQSGGQREGILSKKLYFQGILVKF